MTDLIKPSNTCKISLFMLSYIYVTDGSKHEKRFNNTVAQHYRGSMVYAGDGTPEYLLVPEGMVRNVSGNWVRQYNLTDHLGNTRAVLEPNGSVLQQIDYYPFGAAFAVANTTKNRYLYGGKEYQDEVVGGTLLGLYDFEARFADTRLGVFTTPDPLREKYFSVSPYAYCSNNPVRFIDPDGRQVLERTQRLEMGSSWLLNGLKFAYNSLASVTNIGVDVVNGVAAEAKYIADNGLAAYGKAAVSNLAEGVSNAVSYHANLTAAERCGKRAVVC